jgi:O-antigen/teichoic acid export membrane protein
VRRRTLAANSALALAGDVASKVGALLVVLVAARLLSVAELASFATGLAIASLLACALDLGASTLLARDGAREGAGRGALFRALLRARAPAAAALLVAAPFVGIVLGAPCTALAVAALAVAGSLAVSIHGLYRSCEDIRPEALQKLALAVAAVASVTLAGLVRPRADVLLGVLALVTVATVVPLLAGAPTRAAGASRPRALSVLRRAAPIGLLALATVAYYRSGTIALAALGADSETAAFSVAASVAFGLLLLPNAITTALLPRLSGEQELPALISCARRAFRWTVVLALLVAGAAAVIGPLALPLVLGAEYGRAAAPFALLCAGIPVIAASGVIGTALLAVGRIRVLAVQVACTLTVNLVALALLVPPLGAIGASLATLACETAGLVLLARAAHTALPGLLGLQPPPLGERVKVTAGAARS